MKRILTAAALAVLATSAFAAGKEHKIAMHVDQNDPQVMNMALNNVQNMIAYYKEQGDTVQVEVVTYGPGLNMLVEGKSPVADRIASMSLENDHLTFAACGNTLKGMTAKAGKDVPLLSEAHVVPSGVVRLVELQEEGYSYVRP